MTDHYELGLREEEHNHQPYLLGIDLVQGSIHLVQQIERAGAVEQQGEHEGEGQDGLLTPREGGIVELLLVALVGEGDPEPLQDVPLVLAEEIALQVGHQEVEDLPEVVPNDLVGNGDGLHPLLIQVFHISQVVRSI